MPIPRAHRGVPVLVALTVAAALTPLWQRPAAAAATMGSVTPSVVAEAPDYASENFADRWDYDNADDQRLDSKAGMLDVTNQRMDNSMLRFAVAKASASFDPVLTWPGDLAWGRDGELHPIDASRYTRLSFSLDSTAATTGIVMWFNCPTREASCRGATPFTIFAGRRTYDVELKNTDPSSPLAWAGAITSLRVVPNLPAGTNVAIDWMRVYKPGDTAAVQWSDSTPGNAVDVIWDTDQDQSNNTAANPGWGVVERRTSAASNTTTFNAAAYPPGLYRFYVSDNGAASGYSAPVTVDARPEPVVDDPDASGGADYATAVRGDAWDFSQPTDAAALHNVTNVAFDQGVLSATNTNNDPQVDLPLTGTLDGTRFHRLSFTYSYDGPFGLEDAPGGGTLARIVWQVVGGGPNNYQDLNDLVTYQGTNRVVVDLASSPPTAILDEAQNGARLGWAGRQVSTLRFDANEDPGARRWHLDDLRIAADDAANGAFDVKFHDPAWEQGETADVFIDTDAAGFDGTKVASAIPVTEGINTFHWVPSGLAAGRYFVQIAIRDTRSTGGAYSSGPVQVSAVGRLSGADRIATSIAIADASFPADGSAGAAVLARHDNFPDALAGTPLARAKNAPLLLTQPDGLDSRVEATIKRLVPPGGTVYLLGSEGALSAAVEGRVRALGFTVVRFGGADRYETATRIADGIGAPSDVFLTTGANFPDALSAGAAAGKTGGAILLTSGSTMPAATAGYLQSHPAVRRWAVGTPAAQADPGATSVSGANRYETSRLVAERFFTNPALAAVASGTNFPDALAGGAHAAKNNAPLLLTPPTGLAQPIQDYLAANRSSLATGVIYGGETAVGDNVRSQIEAAIA